MSKSSLAIAELQERLEAGDGPDYWRSLEEAAETEGFQEALHREFAEGASEWKNDPEGRRHFLKIMGAAGALAGLSGCYTNEREHIVPYVEQPESVVPGEADFYATAFPLGGYAQGVLVESHEGRPTKIEGNPAHPASLGATTSFMQASILNLYDPDRADTLLRAGGPSTWQDFVAATNAQRQQWRATGGRGLRILTGTVTSPTLAAQLRALLAAFPQAQWHVHDATAGSEREGARQALGQEAQPLYRFDRAETVLSLGGDLFQNGPGSVRYARDFAQTRRVREGQAQMSRLYAAESSPTLMGAMADHRLPLPPARLRHLAQAVARRLGASIEMNNRQPPADWTERERNWLGSAASDLQAAGSQALVVAGRTQPPAVHALAAAMNEALGAVGTTVEYVPPIEEQPTGEGAMGRATRSLRALTEAMQAGDVSGLVILGENPAYTAPADLPFADLLSEVDFSVHLSRYADETSQRCRWHVPRTHFLEAWGDARAFDGTASIRQPLIRPLYDPCRSVHQVVAALQGAPGQTGYDLVRRYWQRAQGGSAGGFRQFWEEALYRGVVPGTGRFGRADDGGPTTDDQPQQSDGATAPDTSATGAAATGGGANQSQPLLRLGQEPPSGDTTAADTSAPPGTGPRTSDQRSTTGTLELLFRPDPSVWDGRFASNAWLQELPKPLTKLTWGNAALMSPATAERRDLQSQDVVRLHYRGRSLEAPVMVVPGHADGCVTLRLGYGRQRGGYVATGEEQGAGGGWGKVEVDDTVGVDAYTLRTAGAPWGGPGLSLEKTGETFPLATTQHHQSMEGRELIRAEAIDHFRENPDYATEEQPIELPSLYPEYEYDAGEEGPYDTEEAPPLLPEHEYSERDYNYKWGMVIDQNVCTGCNACVVACQSENNIPVVGKEQVMNGREMHWLRIDRYYSGTPSDPETYFQPVPCMHCEKAPCEVVCPVAATVHDAEGLNVMVYNRCIGTRYCSNNCPYKVRRFNFLEWNDWETDSLKLMRNPDVTVRSRGVMEKCTYCIQRISAARIDAKTEERQIRDGEMLTACQQACPTSAIVFGDLNDETATVKKMEEEPHNYALLEHLGTRPRTTYLTHLRNPNAGLAEEEENEIRQQGLDPKVE